MELFPKEIMDRLLENGRESARIRARDHEADFDPVPVVKIFSPSTNATWLLTEVDPDDPDIAFGLCDLGFGTPELGSVRVSELKSVKAPVRVQIGDEIREGKIPLERDLYATIDKPLSHYTAEAREHGFIKI